MLSRKLTIAGRLGYKVFSQKQRKIWSVKSTAESDLCWNDSQARTPSEKKQKQRNLTGD